MSIKLIKEKEEIFPINIKLKSVIVKRDYSLNGTLEVFFSDYNISVIYGENGCGKTTILRLINAFLSQYHLQISSELPSWHHILVRIPQYTQPLFL